MIAKARVYAGDWIADCPVCNSAAKREVDDPVWTCQDCDTAHEVVWPSQEMRYGVARLLMLRPVRHNRNWFPWETLHDLLAENVAHGIGPAEGEAMSIIGGTITLDTLPPPRRLRQIGA